MQQKQSVLFFGVLVLGIILGYFGGIFLNTDNKTNTHQMPDGSMMMNDHAHSSMEDAMHDMTSALLNKTGDDFDKEFLAQMIVHHEGAVEMAELVLKESKRPELISLANDIISAQTKEINMMKAWQYNWFGTYSKVDRITEEETVFCTMDAKICPDGSAVGRQGPNCEFQKCPGEI